jgi:hypothetical protein
MGRLFNPLRRSFMNLATLHLPTRQLRQVLAFDALAGAGLAALHLAFAAPLAAWFGLSEGLLSAMGWALPAFALLAGLLARQRVPARGWLMLLVLGNLVWALACLALAWGGAGVTPLGQAYLTAFAVAVLVLADLEFLGWRAPALRPAV